MKGFSTHNGDVVINKTTIEMVSDSELLRQKVERVIGTNQGEWSYDTKEGINFKVVLCKNPDEGEIRATIEEALKRIDETFTITDFSLTMKGRIAEIHFKAANSNGEEVGGVYSYGG